jgi:hypothetical protein
MMMCCNLDYCIFGLGPSSSIFKTIFRKLDLFPFSGVGQGESALLGPLERTSLARLRLALSKS